MERAAAGDVHCWTIDLCQPAGAVRDLRPILDGVELLTAAQIRPPAHRRRYIVAHALVRRILALYLACDPAEVCFRRLGRGKPEVEGHGLRFNLSHSGEIALLALSGHAAIGVDVEALDSSAAEDVAAMLPHRVQHLLLDLPRNQRAGTFLRAWTRLEAYAKALGDGIEPHLHCLPEFFSLAALDRRGWCIQEINLPQGYVAAIATPGQKPGIKVYHQFGGALAPPPSSPEEKSRYVHHTPSSAFPARTSAAALC